MHVSACYLSTLPAWHPRSRSVAFISLERDWRWRVLRYVRLVLAALSVLAHHHEVFGWFKANGLEQSRGAGAERVADRGSAGRVE